MLWIIQPGASPMRIATTFVRLAVVLTAGLVSTASARADDTGFASIHDLAMVGSKLCIVDHSHHGSGDVMPTKKSAELSAIRSWADFTALEYGTDWANYGLAVGKSASCQATSGGYQCSLDATPCRSGGGGYAAAASGRTAKSARTRTQTSRKAAAQ
jgi:hypothetical protein